MDDDDEPVPMVRSRLRAEVSAFYDGAVRRALADPFVPYENLSGIINLAECETSAGFCPAMRGTSRTARAELVDNTVAELTQLFGQSGVEATPALAVKLVAPGVFDDTTGDAEENEGGRTVGSASVGTSSGGGLVLFRAATPFQRQVPTWEGEADWENSLVETYGILLAPGMLRGAAEPGWFLMCVAGRDEETLLTGGSDCARSCCRESSSTDGGEAFRAGGRAVCSRTRIGSARIIGRHLIGLHITHRFRAFTY